MSNAKRPAEVALPVAALAALRRDLVAELGDDRAAHVLREAGRSAGDALAALLAPGGGASGDGEETGAGALPARTFWRRLGALLAERGWGHLEFREAHPGLGALEAADLAESDATEAAARPSCHFTAGMLANLLGRVADGPIGVLEVECRSRGDLRCRFLFGGAAALEQVHGRLAAGKHLEAALEALG